MSIAVLANRVYAPSDTPLETLLSTFANSSSSTSTNTARLESRTVINALTANPAKAYDVANEYLAKIDDENTAPVILLIDLFEYFPASLGALTTYAITQIYRVLKKSPTRSPLLVYLLATVLKNAVRADIDDKTHAKLLKLATKNALARIHYDASTETSVLCKRNYLLCIKTLVLFSITAHYEGLVGASASAKLKPDALFALQHQFQSQVLAASEKPIVAALASHSREVRTAAVETLAHVTAGLVPTGRDDGVTYLLGLYGTVPDVIEDDSESAVAACSAAQITQALVCEALVLYLQLTQLQNADFLGSNVERILDALLVELTGATEDKVRHFTTVAEFVVREAGTMAHGVLAAYVRARLHESAAEKVVSVKKKRESIWFKGKTKKLREGGTISPQTNPAQASLLLRVVEMLAVGGEEKDEKEENEAKEEREENEEKEEKDDGAMSHVGHLTSALFALVSNDNEHIRTYAARTLLEYAAANDVAINTLITTAFRHVTLEYKSGNGARLMAHALVLLALIRRTPYDLLQNSTLVKILSFCTQNLKHDGDTLRASACWMVLAGIVGFHDESEFVRLNTSQLLVFWKLLLTSQYLGGGGDGVTPSTHLLHNLHLRNFALVCLLSYIEAVTFTPESLKQVQFLLTKSYNYITYLESNIAGVTGITDFGTGFGSAPYNVDDLSNVLFSTAAYLNTLAADRHMVALVLYAKKVMLQCFVKLAEVRKHDINSNMIIFVVKIFSDPRVFSRPQGEKKKRVLTDAPPDALLFNDDTTHWYGISSGLGRTTLSLVMDVFFDVSTNPPKSIVYDPLSLMSGTASPRITTALVDLAMELFEHVFPFLSAQIQFSLLEQMRGALTAEADPMRVRAVHVNTAVAVHGMLERASRQQRLLERELAQSLLDVVGKISLKHPEFVAMNAESVGYAVGFLDEAGAAAASAARVHTIVTDESPHVRGRAVLELAYVFAHTHHGFESIFDVAMQLAGDPHPIVHHYALRALVVLLDSNPAQPHTARVLACVVRGFEENQFGYEVDNRAVLNWRVAHGVAAPALELLRGCVRLLGPAISEKGEVKEKDGEDNVRTTVFSLIVGFSLGASFQTSNDYDGGFTVLLGLLQELVMFDRTLFDAAWIARLLDAVIVGNMKTGSAVASPTTMASTAVFPFRTSDSLYTLAFETYTELVQLWGARVLSADTQRMLWVAMQVKPVGALMRLLELWMDSSLDAPWFATLHGLFRLLARKLTGAFVSVHFLRKLLPLAQREKKAGTRVELHDEEAEGIVGHDEAASDKSEPIGWEFQNAVLALLQRYLCAARGREDMAVRLERRVADLVKMCFLGSTSPVQAVRLQGVTLLDSVLALFGDRADPLWEDKDSDSKSAPSVLEQEQAQIISALMPCFSATSDVRVMVRTIHVCLTFINLARIKYYSKQRILRTLIDLLEEISSGQFLRFGYLDNMSEHGRKSIQLAILNCWALLRIGLCAGADSQLEETLTTYQKLLTSLWVLCLREFSSLKVSGDRELDLYSDYWINFISVLTIELAEQPTIGDPQFFFVLFSQCVELLIRNKNVAQVLSCMAQLVRNPDLARMLYNRDIFAEVVDLLDRLVLIDSAADVQKGVVEVVVGIIEGTQDGTVSEESGTAFSFELLRVAMLPLFRILPFLRTDYDANNEVHHLTLKSADSAANLLVLRYTLQLLLQIVARFPTDTQVDLHACLLYIFSKVYEYGNERLIQLVLPHVKTIALTALREMVATFFATVRSNYDISRLVPTTLVLVTSGDVVLSEDESKSLATALAEMTENEPELAVQCIRLLLLYSQKKPVVAVKYLVSELVFRLSGDEGRPDWRKLAFDVLFLFTHNVLGESKLAAMYTVLIPLLVKHEGTLSSEYLQERMLFLAKQSQQSFRAVVVTLSDEQKTSAEKLLIKGSEQREEREEEQIQLKTFGE